MKGKEVNTYFEADARWKSVFEITTIEEYKTKFGIEVNFNSNVPEELQKGGSVIEAMIVYAYYNHDILDEVIRKVFGVFELSIKLKTLALGGELEKVNNNGKSRAIVLDHLIKQFKDQKDLEPLVPLLDALRKARNNYANPKQHNVDISMILDNVKEVVGVINDMFK
jgi:hypothetical protein